MIAAFDTADVNKAASAFNPAKLWRRHPQHLMRADPTTVVPYLKPHLARVGIEAAADDAFLARIVVAQRERVKTLKEMAQASRYFFGEAVELDAKAAAKHLGDEGRAVLTELRATLAGIADWTAAPLNAALNALATARGIGLGKVAQPLRVAVTGNTISPPIDLTLELLGRERSLARLDRALQP